MRSSGRSLSARRWACSRSAVRRARVVAGGTDVLVELQRGVKPTATLIDVSALRELKYVRRAGDTIALGGLATHNDVLAAPFAQSAMLPLAQACVEVGAPQIRTRGTIAGNLVTASPANDTIAPLIALEAEIVLASAHGERIAGAGGFLHRLPAHGRCAPDELVREIRFRALGDDRRGIFLKLGLRRAQAISVIDLALVVELAADGTVREARIALGCLAPTVVRAPGAEAFLRRRAARRRDLRRGRPPRLRGRRPDRRRARLGGLPPRDARRAGRPRPGTDRRRPRGRPASRPARCCSRRRR